MEWIKRHKKKLISSLLTLCLICSMVFLATPQVAKAETIQLTYRDENYVGDSQNDEDWMLQFRCVNDRILYYPYNTTTHSFSISNQDILEDANISNGDLCYGTEQSPNSNRWALYYPFTGEYVFPAAKGPVSHYEMDFQFKVLQCYSAEMFLDAFPNRSGDVWQYQPYSQIDHMVFGYVDRNGNYREVDTNNSWIKITNYYCTNESDNNLTVGPDAQNYWNKARTNDDIKCHIKIRIEEFPEDFNYFISTYVFFGRNFYFKYNSQTQNSLYLEVGPLVSTLATIYYSQEYYDDNKAVNQWREDIMESIKLPPTYEPPVLDIDPGATEDKIKDYLDLEQSVDAQIDAMYKEFGNDPDSFGTVLADVVHGLQRVVSPRVFTNVYILCERYDVIYWFMNTAITFCVLVFLLRR